MEKYAKPEMQITEIQQDVILTSGGSTPGAPNIGIGGGTVDPGDID